MEIEIETSLVDGTSYAAYTSVAIDRGQSARMSM